MGVAGPDQARGQSQEAVVIVGGGAGGITGVINDRRQSPQQIYR